jgi:hypothetical protein
MTTTNTASDLELGEGQVPRTSASTTNQEPPIELGAIQSEEPDTSQGDA